MLVRLRLIGGRVTRSSLLALAEVAETHGDGKIHVTSRSNLQLRGLPGDGDVIAEHIVAAIESTGLLPSRTHELVRNVMVSPQTGLAGGLCDLRPVAEELDHILQATSHLASLPGRFLFVLDDGRGDLVDRTCDLGLVALGDEVQLRIGDTWGPMAPVSQAAQRMADLAGEFLARRGTGASAAWHIRELTSPLAPTLEADRRVPQPSTALAYGEIEGGHHFPVAETGLDRAAIEILTASVPEVIITPWRGVLVPKEQS